MSYPQGYEPLTSPPAPSFPSWAIILLSVVGGVAFVAVTCAVYRCQMKRRRSSDVEDDFPPFQRFAVNRGRVVPASWHMSIGAILGLKSDRDSFMALNDNFTGGRRRSKRSIFSRRTSISSKRSKRPMSQAPPTPTVTTFPRPATKAGNFTLLEDIDASFASKSPRPGTTQTFHTSSSGAKETGQDTSTVIPKTLSPLELGSSFADSVSPFSDAGMDKETDPLNPLKQPRHSLQRPSLLRSRYSTLGPFDQSSTPIPLSRQSSTPNLTAVKEDTTDTRPPKGPKSPRSPKGPKSPRPSSRRKSSTAVSTTTQPQVPLPRKPSLRGKYGIRPHLTPINVPAPVLAASAPSLPLSPLSPKSPRRFSRLSRLSLRAPPSPSAQSTFSDISSTYSVVQARPAVRVSTLQSPPSDMPPHPRYSHLHSNLNLSSSSLQTVQSGVTVAAIPPKKDLERKPSKKGKVLRKKSLKRSDSTQSTAVN